MSDVLKVQHHETNQKKSTPTFEQLVADSEKILATIKMAPATTGSVSAKEKPMSEKELNEPTNTSKFGLSRSSFSVFYNKLPFGCFEEDI